MTGLLSRWWQVIAIAIVLVALAGFAWGIYAGHSVADASWRERWSLRDKADTQAMARREAAERTKEQRRQQEITRITDDAQQQIKAARTDADNASAAGERLQQTIIGLQRRLREGNTSGNTGSTCSGQPTAGQCSLLANVLAESVERNQHLAAEADRRRIAGLACEAAFNSIRNVY